MRAYHLRDAAVVTDRLARIGVTSRVIDTDKYRRGGEEVGREASKLAIERLSFRDFVAGRTAVGTVILWNDWDPLMRVIAHVCHEEGIGVIGWVEGVNDYNDVDTGMQRFAYRRSYHVIVPGEFDRKYFSGTGQDVQTGEVVRVCVLWKSRIQRSRQTSPRKALINSNFSYGVLADARDRWVGDAIQACLSADIQPVLSRHPFDAGTRYQRYETRAGFVEALQDCVVSIQRFGSGILESLALGVPVIYFNPHGEGVDKFTDPMGAYLIALSADRLRAALRNTEFSWDEARAKAFLKIHAGLNSDEAPGSAIANAIERILAQAPAPSTALTEALERHPVVRHAARLPWLAQAIGPIYVRPDEMALHANRRFESPFEIGPSAYASFGDWLQPRFPNLYAALRRARRTIARVLARLT